ncbi:MAG: phosphoglycerate kinase [Candidatus Harrisonbacteria bacterium CG10_big_fil_rev_8_21_14_0_10_45_28]|uniref:Phosphoglycerate kinase n=1 Tax=Candidatus Harrisonbacteria bacterium CG10_big_fil_rev_8_21_14_0_10_45_28 TaxID=1974586 RepID=A0A2H0UNX4_9BACT|nr:MAG: phosphoglycerate kinase [Candidatus Harrisonbacteria bacterium CG10_big_fil_rev_8_21_14_0_10_45_28]
MKFVEEIGDLNGKVVLLRVDLNVEMAEDALRLDRSLKTIDFLLDKGGRVILMSHRGRPEKNLGEDGYTEVEDALSLRFALDFFYRNLNLKIEFLPDFDFEAHKTFIEKSDSKVFMLENVRLHSGEDGEDEEFGKQLASLGDVYVNDAFASWHKGTSVTVLPRLLPAFAGLLMAEELKHLSHALDDARGPLLVILAGGKAQDKFSVVENFYNRADKFLIAGVLANTLLKVAGEEIGLSIVDDEILGRVAEYASSEKIQLPIDFVRDEAGRIMDMGKKSEKLFAELISTASSVIWNGPTGVFEVDKYRAGSEAVARAIAENKGFSIVGGGETTNLILQMGLEDSFTWLSTGGGAMLAFLAGKKLPSLEALGYYQDK